MPRKDFVEMLRTIAAKHDFEFTALSHDWIIKIVDPATSRQCNVFGYTFDTNPAGALEICREKAATSLVLEHHGVPSIPHAVFLNPASPLCADYVQKTGNWQRILELTRSYDYRAVLKPLKGTGGVGVMRAACQADVERAVQLIFQEEYGLAVSPLKRIREEYRAFVLNGDARLVYRKQRLAARGDGRSSVRALGARLAERAADPKVFAQLVEALSEMPREELARVPERGAEVAIQWKHNLGQGAVPDLRIAEDVSRRVKEMAKRAATAVGAKFCSVDVVDIEEEGLAVMEINSGVMMDNLIGHIGEQASETILKIYEDAILSAIAG